MSASGKAVACGITRRHVAILGAGPAGMSAALWLKHLGFVPQLFEAEAMPGGMQRFNFLHNEWVLGQIGLTGPELSRRFAEHMRVEEIDIARQCRIGRIERIENRFAVNYTSDDGIERQMECAAVVVATGLRFRAQEVLANVTGADRLQESEVAFGPYAFVGLEGRRGQSVLILGCGDNAFENAKMLLEYGAAEVVLLCRSQPRAQRVLQEALRCFPGRWRVLLQAQLRAVMRDQERIGAVITSPGGECRLYVDRLHVLVGYEPNTAFLLTALGPQAQRLACDAMGFIEVDAWGRTSLPGFYAAGDVCNPDFPNVVSAIASGAKAAKAIEIDLRVQ